MFYNEHTLNMLIDSKNVASPDWWMHAKIYELYIDKFAGNIRGLTARIDYFNRLGIDCIHLLPHYPSPMDDEGYDVSDYRGVRPELGTVDDLREFFTVAREHGVRAIVDLVLNHVSVEHPWFLDARRSHESSKRDYFLWSTTGNEFPESVNPFPDFKSSNWIPNPDTNDFYFSTFNPSQADLNWDNPEVLREILEVIDHLVELGASGFRLDAVAHLIKREHTNSKDLPETHTVLRQIRTHMDRHHPGVILFGEVSAKMDVAKSYFGNDDECHLVYSFQFAAEMLYALRTGDLHYLEEVGRIAAGLPPHSTWAAYLRNHDEINLGTIDAERRRVLVDLFDPERRYPFKNGNETSMRLMSAFGGNQDHVKNAFRLLYSLSFATVTYYGDEIGMENLVLAPETKDTRLAVRGTFDWEEAKRQMADPESLWNSAARMIKGSSPT